MSLLRFRCAESLFSDTRITIIAIDIIIFDADIFITPLHYYAIFIDDELHYAIDMKYYVIIILIIFIS